MARVRSIPEVAERRLCTGCGVCAYLAPSEFTMVDVLDEGRRPLPLAAINGRTPGSGAGPGSGSGAGEAFAACPGVGLSHPREAGPGELPELRDAWGPVLAVWEGYAADPATRYAGSSGGVATALAAYCLRTEGFHGVLHAVARTDVPYLNTVQLSTDTDQLLAATGSRYAPASPAEGLGQIESAPGECVFIGKPCDVAGASAAAALRPALASRLGLTIAMFCAGTPSTRGTLEMLRVMGVDPEQVTDVRYRGNGWPGDATATTADGTEHRLTYHQSWGEILQKHRQWRCHLCADHTGEFADVAVGDPWYEPPTGDDPGRSLVLARTVRGLRIIQAAIDAGALTLMPADPGILPASQPNLLLGRGDVWGRVATLRLAGLPAPRYRRLPMFGIWLRRLSLRRKLRSAIGTLRRIRRKHLRTRAALTPYRSRKPVSDGE
ncbi:MAG: Coenzyme F420 hydrogenase/dehydrogenase, beta subunit C-terminal domain [Micromonosporaceae bacterium]